MKKVFIALSLMLTFATTVFANDEIGVNEKTKAVFKKEFPAAESVRWDVVEEHVRARFMYDGHFTIAYFSKDGEMEGFGREIPFDQLPLKVQRSLGEYYAVADFKEVLEVPNEEGTDYWLTVEKQHKKFRVRISSYGNVLTQKRIWK